MIVLAIALVAINSLICTYLFVRKCEANSPFQFFYLSLLSLVMLPAFLDTSTGYFVYHPFAPPIQLSPELIFNAHLKILPMVIIFFVTEKVLDLKFGTSPINLYKQDVYINIYDSLIVLILLFIAFGLYYYGFGLMASTSLDALRSGALGSFSLILFYLQIVIIGVPGFYILRFGRPLTGAVVLVIFITTYLLLGGSRQIIVMSLAITGALILINLGRWRYVLLLLLFTVGFSSMDIVLQLIKALRNLPSMDARLYFISGIMSGDVAISNFGDGDGGSESIIRYVMYGFLTENPPPDFGNLQYFWRSMLFWLPSDLDVFDIKPDDFEAVMFAQAMGNRIGTMHATFFGSAYADAGNFAFIWIVLFSSLFRSMEAFMTSLPNLQRSIVWGSGVYLAFMVSRGSFYAPLVVTCLVVFLAMISKTIGNGLERNATDSSSGSNRALRKGTP